MRESVRDRRRRILVMVQARGRIRVRDLAAELQVSMVTVRRDIEELVRRGDLRRGHGVVSSLDPVEGRSVPVTGNDRAIALVMPERHPYLNEVVHGARTALEAAGTRVVLHITPYGMGAERPIVERVPGQDVRGLLISPRWRSGAREREDYAWLSGLDVPTVLVERRPDRGGALHGVDSVCTDHWYGVHLALEHLVALGHRRILLAVRADSPTARAVRAAFTEIASAHPAIEATGTVLSAPGADPDGGTVEAPDFDDPTWPAKALRGPGATAALVHGDVEALMMVQQLAQAGVRVPQDCSVIAYDDVVAAMGSTPLTAVAPPKTEIGRVAAELIGERLDARERGATWSPRRVELLPRLVVRASTGRVIV
ncbi:substrate-binding domain-containing protein [Nocardiopsis sp. MG754419]|uniref:substrate-binding domain-containing protein n=1 Tax=Nocardiopsis sp. MG754419 TaxID=2259865 RepID=UPI001BADAF66|nr:substrate-binding domain-containing protein [Nocardiopsis sp. MG754419]MBR8740131.1 LacI family transcriptional regulator [Nocardiopsis sp. MG754419]